MCMFWLAHALALALACRVNEATAAFERAISFSNDVGLLSERWTPPPMHCSATFPQAFSHVIGLRVRRERLLMGGRRVD